MRPGRARIVLGAQVAQHDRRGMGRYSTALVRAVTAAAGERVVRVEQDPSCALAALDACGRPVTAPHRAAPRPRGAEPLVYHVMAPFHAGHIDLLWPRWARAADVALAVTLYDLIPLHAPEDYLPGPVDRAVYRARLELVRRADAVLAISRSSADSAADALGLDADRLHVVSAASTLEGRDARAGEPGIELLRRALPELRGGFIVNVSAPRAPHKNLERVLTAYAALGPELIRSHQLVLAGFPTPAVARAVAARASGLGIGSATLIAPMLTDEQLACLYSCCELAILASLTEGFGLPALEAMALGAPTIVSDIPSMRELVPRAAARFDPRSVGEIARALRTALSDPDRRARLRDWGRTAAAPFTWDRVAERSLSAYEAAVSRRARPRRSERSLPSLPSLQSLPSLAIVSPLAPDRGGVSDYTARLAAALADHGRVVVYAERDPAPPAALSRAGVRCMRLDLLLAAAFDPPDLPPLFCIGNSHFHVRSWSALRRLGGDVLLHDVQLRLLYEALVARGRRRPAAEPEREMLIEVVGCARRVLVHSRHARELIVAACPERAGDVYAVPFGVPAAVPGPYDAAGRIMMTAGYVGDAGLLFETIGRLVHLVPGLSVELVGGWPLASLPEARELISAHGLDGTVELTGWLEQEDYLNRLRRATIAVELRDGDRGESSASVADLLALGVPTVVVDAGAGAELPRDAVWHVPGDVDAAGLAETIAGLLGDPESLARLRAGALAHAARNSFARAAAAIWGVLVAPDDRPR